MAKKNSAISPIWQSVFSILLYMLRFVCMCDVYAVCTMVKVKWFNYWVNFKEINGVALLDFHSSTSVKPTVTLPGSTNQILERIMCSQQLSFILKIDLGIYKVPTHQQSREIWIIIIYPGRIKWVMCSGLSSAEESIANKSWEVGKVAPSPMDRCSQTK